jgi:hypothetical protein
MPNLSRAKDTVRYILISQFYLLGDKKRQQRGEPSFRLKPAEDCQVDLQKAAELAQQFCLALEIRESITASPRLDGRGLAVQCSSTWIVLTGGSDGIRTRDLLLDREVC